VRTIVYKAGPYRSTELLVRDVSRDFRLHRPPQVPIEGFTGLPAADPKDVGFASSFPQILPWTMIAAGLLGLAAFLQFLRLRRRLEKQGL
jgi:hypothetical protein